MISLAGPAVNFLLVALLWFLFYLLALDYHAAGYVPADWWSILQAALARRLPEMPDLAAMFCELAAYGWWVNVSLGILNLMPVFPLDGGQAVYRILQMTVDERQARSSTLAISVVGAIGCIALFTWLSGEPSTFLIVLMLFLLYQAWSTLA
jgi:Zn-dependent protease